MIEASHRCEQIGGLLREIRDELSHVDFPHSDKQHLRTGLSERAAAWSVRGREWRAPRKPNARAAAAKISAHERAALDEFAHVKPYLVRESPGGLR